MFRPVDLLSKELLQDCSRVKFGRQCAWWRLFCRLSPKSRGKMGWEYFGELAEKAANVLRHQEIKTKFSCLLSKILCSPQHSNSGGWEALLLLMQVLLATTPDVDVGEKGVKIIFLLQGPLSKRWMGKKSVNNEFKKIFLSFTMEGDCQDKEGSYIFS